MLSGVQGTLVPPELWLARLIGSEGTRRAECESEPSEFWRESISRLEEEPVGCASGKLTGGGEAIGEDMRGPLLVLGESGGRTFAPRGV